MAITSFLATFEGKFLLYSLTVLLVLVIDAFLLGRFIFHKLKHHQPKISDSIKSINLADGIPVKKYTVGVGLTLGMLVRRMGWVLWRSKFIILELFIIAFCVYEIRLLLLPRPRIVSTYPTKNSILTSYDFPIEIEFNVPIDTTKLIRNYLPEVGGTWKYDTYSPLLPYARKIRFYPAESFTPGKKVMFYFSYIANPLYPKTGNEDLFEFDAPPLPDVVSVEPQDGAENVTANSGVVLGLSSRDGVQVEWDFELDPAVEFSVVRTDSTEVAVKFEKELEQGTHYRIKAYRIPISYDLTSRSVKVRGDKELVREFSFKTVKAPLVASFKPEGTAVLPNTTITVVFDEPMVKEGIELYFVANPAIDGTLTWDEPGKVLTYVPNALAKSTDYEIKLLKGLKNTTGGTLKSDLAYTFSTIGAVAVIGNSPVTGRTGISTETPVSIAFNQEVDHASAQSKFSINPPIAGIFTWNGNTMNFLSTVSYANSTTYTYALASGVKSVYGLDSTVSFSASFTTGTRNVLLTVPLYYQQESFTCNVAAARMLLGYRDVNISEASLKALIGTNGSRGNGNPHKGWVADYGVYWEPVSAAIGNYRQNAVHTNWNIRDLLTEVQNGNPVMIWGQNQWSTPDNISWTASDGTYVHAISGMHSLVVKGFAGSIDNPTAIYLNDSWRGDRAVNLSTFTYIFNFFKTGLVIY